MGELNQIFKTGIKERMALKYQKEIWEYLNLGINI